jgi:serine/threonine protein kinase/tetratricopeptide (TPR) repeat protein
MVNSAENDERVAAIVSKALRQPPAKRESYLRFACDDNQELYQETAAAVMWEERMGSFLLLPAIATREFPRPFEAGQIISERFEVLREIGEGGMGVVYEAFDRKRSQRIAIKSAKPGFHRLLTPELASALKVRHPHVCLVNEIHTTQTSYGEVDFLTMEYLEGETLSNRLAAQGKLPNKEALEIACQLCAGLAEAHRSDVLHRDFKSANIILCSGSNGVRAVITDFGLASDMTQSGEMGGTPRYMAPELWRGEKASKASDIYSLGVVLYEMVTGRPPIEDEADRLRSRPPPPSTLAKGLGPRWDRTILECLRPAPEDRPEDAALVLSGLRKKPMRKAPFLALILLLSTSLAVPQVRGWLRDLIWPPQNVRLAILPSEGPADTAVMAGGVLQDVSDRIGHLRSGRRAVAVISPSEAVINHIQTPEQANQVLHATHALQTKVHREGDELALQASLIDLSTHVPVRQFSGRYSPATVGSMPEALAGVVSAALRLHGTLTTETLSREATAPYDRGLYLLRKDDQGLDEAIPQFEEAARLNPRSPLPLAGLTEAELMKFQGTAAHGTIEDAQRFLNAAESLNPDSVSVLLAAGLLHQTTGQYEKALEDFRRVQDLEPRNPDAFLRSASVYNRLDMSDKAIEDYRKAIELEPDYYKPYHKLGGFYYYRGRYLEAAEQFQKAIDRAPGLFEAYTDLGAAMSDLGRNQEAEQALLTSLKLRETARAWNSLGAIRAYQDRDADAVKYYTRAVTMDPGEYLYWLNLGDSNRRSGRLADAKLAYRKGLNLALIELGGNPRLGLTRAHVAYFAARLGDATRGQDEISQALEMLPGDAEVIVNAVLTYETLRERDQAIKVLGLATPEVLEKLNRQPDLADFRQDIRFIQVVREMEGRR